ncbi:MAG: hypothetical protein AB8B56_19780 [Crocinitomicaceae bacterium]
MNKYLFSIALISLALTSCDKDEEPVANPDGSFPDPIELSGTMSVSRTLTNHVADPSVPDYCISGDYFVEANLTVEPGVYIQMKNDSRIRVRNSGTFYCVGTSNDKITISGENSIDAGQWENIHFSTPSSANQLVHTDISGGGNSSTYDGMVFIGYQGRALIQDCFLSFSSTNGIKTESTGSILGGISDCIISLCALYPIEVNARQVPAIATSNTGAGNGHDQINVREVQLQNPATWDNTYFPYHINGNLSVNTDWTVEPGVTFVFAQGAQIDIFSGGSMNCIGTASDNIRFIGETSTAGSWDGVTFISSTNPLNHFEYCNFLNGGGHQNYEGMITLWTNAEARVGNCSFTNSASWGILVSSSSTLNDDGNNTFNGNAFGSINP